MRQSTHQAQYRVRVAQALVRIRQAIAVVTRGGGNRMRESCKYGSVRGAPASLPRPARVHHAAGRRGGGEAAGGARSTGRAGAADRRAPARSHGRSEISAIQNNSGPPKDLPARLR
jgi:hypothetical protein